MSLILDEIPILSTNSFEVDTQDVQLESVAWIEFLNESPYTLKVSIGGLNFPVPAWCDYPKQISTNTNGVWQNLNGAQLPVLVTPMALASQPSNLSSILVATLYLTGELPSNLVPVSLARQVYIPNTVNNNAVSNTLSYETGTPGNLVIDIGTATNNDNWKVKNDGSAVLQVEQGGTPHIALTLQSSGSPALWGQSGDYVEVQSQLLLENQTPLNIRDTGGVARQVLQIDAFNNVQIRTPSTGVGNGGEVYFTNRDNSINFGYWDQSGLHLGGTDDRIWLGIGTLNALQEFHGTGNGNVNTGVVNPLGLAFNPCTVSGSSQTIGGTIPGGGSSTTTVTTGAGLAWSGQVYRN